MNVKILMRPSRRILIVCLFVFHSAPLRSQGLQKEWTREFSVDPTKANGPVAALVAPDGSLVVGGTSQSATGDKNYQVIKYRTSGEEAWRASFASAEPGTADDARAMAIDSNGNIIVTGTTRTVKFNSAGQRIWDTPVPGRAVVATADYVYVTGISDIDIVTAQLQNNDTNGEEIWRRVIDGTSHQTDIGQAITLDASGNIYIGGQLGLGCAPGQCDYRFAVASYTPAGAQRFFGESQYDGPTPGVLVLSIVILDDGSPATFGIYSQGPYFSKFSAQGAFEWRHNYATIIRLSHGSKMILDRVTGDFVIAGRRVGSAERIEEAFVGVIKQDRSYQSIWSYSSNIGFTTATDLVQDSKGNFIVIGLSRNDAVSTSMFAAKLTSAGQQIGLDRYVSPGRLSNVAVAAAVDGADNAYVTGYTVNSQGGTEWVTIKYPAAPKIEQKPSGAMHLEFYTSPGQRYAIEATSDFFNWQSLVTNTADVNGIVRFEDTNVVNIPYRFYRGNSAP